MAVTDLLDEIHDAGLMIVLDGDRIGLQGDPSILADWAPRLRKFKDDILAEMRRRLNPPPEPVQDFCSGCAHHRRPGIDNRYCAGRDDLARAYGEGHPLRRLPDDLGEGCQKFKLALSWQR